MEMKKKIYVKDEETKSTITADPSIDWGRSREGYARCPKCTRVFSIYSSRINGHVDACSKLCKFGRIRKIEKDWTKAEKRAARQLRRQLRLKKKSDPFFSTREWKDLRFKVLRRFGFRCLACGARPPDVVLHVDHIKPRLKYPDLELNEDNLQVLCADCNEGKSYVYEDDLRHLEVSTGEGIPSDKRP